MQGFRQGDILAPLVRERLYLHLGAIFVLCAGLVNGADVSSVWSGGSGSWAEPTNWIHSPTNSGATFPNNGALTYGVTVSLGEALLLQPVTIDDFRLNGGVVVNESVLTVTNGFTLLGGTLAGTGVYKATGAYAYGSVTNESWLRLGGTSELYSVHHRGTIEIEENGIAVFYDGVSSGRFLVGSNAALFFGGTNHLAHGTAIIGEGRVNPGRALFIDGTVTNTCDFEIRSPVAFIDGPGNLILAEDATVHLQYLHLMGAGKIEAGPNTRVTFAGPSFSWANRTFENHGTVLFSNVVSTGHSWTLHNRGEMEFCYDDFFLSNNQFRWSGTGIVPVIVNHGLLAFTNVWWGTLGLGVNVTNYGNIVGLYWLHVSNFVNFADTRLDCIVTANTFHNRAGNLSLSRGVTAPVTNDAVIHILTNEFSRGIGGPFHQSSNGVLRLDLGTAELGTNYALRISGPASFDGALDVRLHSDAQPVAGQRFRALTFESAHGLFARVEGLDIGGGLRLAPIMSSNSLDLLVVNVSNPSTSALRVERESASITLHVAPEFQGYFLQATTDLVHGTWETLTFAPTTIVVPIDPGTPQRFFRLRDPGCCEWESQGEVDR